LAAALRPGPLGELERSPTPPIAAIRKGGVLHLREWKEREERRKEGKEGEGKEMKFCVRP